MTDGRRDRLRLRLTELAPGERAAVARELHGAVGDPPGRLTAYVTPSGPSLDAADLARHLSALLPEYMVPARFVELDRLPRTRAGKLDRRALRATAGRELQLAGTRFVEPRTDMEVRLAEIWKEVLGMDEIGVHDDFFEVGGDSLLSVRVIARAGREGLALRPELFFENPTIAWLAARLEGADGERTASGDRGPVRGEAPLTPIQHWFFERIAVDPDHWNQTRAFTVPDELDAAALERALAALVAHHDALRLRISSRDGTRVQIFEDLREGPMLRHLDLGGVDPASVDEAVAAACTETHASLRLEKGSLFRALLVEGTAGPRRLILLAHHVLVDWLSWDLLAEDLDALLTGALAGEPVELPPRTTSALEWAHALQELAAREELVEEAAAWMATVPTDATRLPDRGPSAPGAASPAEPDRVEDALARAIALDGAETRGLGAAAARLGATARDLLVAAACLAWRRWTGAPRLQLDLEGHGRDLLPELDVSRTVGWFTTVFPLYVEARGETPASVLRAAREALDALPSRGGGTHGLIRYLSDDAEARSTLAARPRSPLLLNYSRHVSRVEGGTLRPAADPGGVARSPAGPLAYPVEINAVERDGCLQLRLLFTGRLGEAGADAFTDAMRGALEAVATADPERFELSGLGREGLRRVDDLLAEIDEV